MNTKLARKEQRWWVLVATVPAFFIALFFIWPILSLILVGLFDGFKFDAAGLVEVLSQGRTWQVVGQTLAQATAATIMSVVLGLPAAFMLFRLHFRGRKILRAILTIPFVLPTVVVAAAFIALFGPGGMFAWLNLDQTFTVLIFALTFFNVTVVMRVVGGFWENLDPRQTEAARMLGASPTRAFLTITLPALWRPIASAASLVFLFCATSFGVVFVLGGKQFANIETEIYRSTMQLLDLRTAAVLSILQIMIVVIALYISSKFKPQLAAESKSTDRRVIFNLKDHLPVMLIFGATVLILHLIPLAALAVRSVQNVAGQWSLSNYLLLLNPPESSPLGQSVTHSIGLSLAFACIAMVLSLAIGVTTAFVVSRRVQTKLARGAQTVYEHTMMLPLGVSAVTLGLGLLITMHDPLGLGIDLRSTSVLIPVAQTLIALPLVIRTVLPRLQAVSQRTKEAATMLGASNLRIIFTVELPQIKNAIAVAAGFAFAASLGEFGAAAFLVRAHDKTLPVVIAQLLSHPDPVSHGMGIAAAVLLGVITASVMVAAESVNIKKKLGWVAW